MRKTLLVLALCTVRALASPPVLDQVVLVDVSGSMRSHGYSTRQSWGTEVPQFLNQLLAPEGKFFATESQMLLLPFSDARTDRQEGRETLGPVPLDQRSEKISEMAPPGAGATDMARALDLGQQLAANCSHPALIWLLTDNENNFSTNQSDRQFYERLRDSSDYSHVVLFPLADPVGHPQDSLVMYLLVPPKTLDTDEVNQLAKEVEKRTGFGGMLFRPLYQQTAGSTLDFSKELTFEGTGKHRVEQEAGQTVLYFNEGDKLQGNLRFNIRSRLKGWKVQGASLQDAEVSLRVPPVYVDHPPQDGKLHWQVTPKTLEVDAEKDSLTVFSLHIAGPNDKPIRLQRTTSQMLSNPFASSLPEVQGDVKMTATLHVDEGNLQPQVSPEMQERLKAVPRLSEVEDYMLQQADSAGGEADGAREISFQRKLIVRVKPDPTGAIVFGILLAGIGLVGAGLMAAALLWRHTLQVEGPGVDEEFAVAGLMGSYMICDAKGQPYCHVQSRLGSLSVVAEPDFFFQDEARKLPVRWEGDEFRFEVGPEGKASEVFWLRRRSGGSSGGAGGGSESPL